MRFSVSEASFLMNRGAGISCGGFEEMQLMLQLSISLSNEGHLIVEGSQDLLEMVFFIAIHHLLIREADLPGYLLILQVLQLLGEFFGIGVFLRVSCLN